MAASNQAIALVVSAVLVYATAPAPVAVALTLATAALFGARRRK